MFFENFMNMFVKNKKSKIVDFINKNTLLIGTGHDYLINNIYSHISSQVNRLYVVTNSTTLGSLANETYGAEQFEKIHQSMLNSFHISNLFHCCVIIDNFNTLDYNNNK